jgi:hypothetical protein
VSLDLGGAFNLHTFSAERETVATSVVEGNTAVITTTFYDFNTRWRGYHPACVDGDWKLTGFTDYLDDPDSRLIPEAELSARIAGVQGDAPLAPLPPTESWSDLNLLFSPREVVDDDGDISSIAVRHVGEFRSTSGILTVFDFGRDLRHTSPLARRVPPGMHAVDVAHAYGRAAALRVTLAPCRPVSWHPADTVDGGNVQGVDAGNLAILDFGALAAARVRDKELAYDEWAGSGEVGGALLTLGSDEPIGAISSSGWGDGGYPSFWGTDESGNPVQLIVDFLVLRAKSNTTLCSRGAMESSRPTSWQGTASPSEHTTAKIPQLPAGGW